MYLGHEVSSALRGYQQDGGVLRLSTVCAAQDKVGSD
jgi:hypothetical protein